MGMGKTKFSSSIVDSSPQLPLKTKAPLFQGKLQEEIFVPGPRLATAQKGV